MLDVGKADDLRHADTESIDHSRVGSSNRDLLSRHWRNVGPDESDRDTLEEIILYQTHRDVKRERVDLPMRTQTNRLHAMLHPQPIDEGAG